MQRTRGKGDAMQRFALLCLILAITSPQLASAAQPADDDRVRSPFFQVKDGDPGVDKLPLLRTDVSVDVSGVIADVTVRQTYKNGGTRPLNATYVFPGSTRAAVHGMTMTIGSRTVTAKIQEKGQARATYQRARSEGKSASLLEQDAPNTFTMNVANVMPGDRIEVELHYTELLVPDEGTYELVYPTVAPPRYGNGPGDPTIRDPLAKQPLSFEATIGSAIPIASVSSPSHEIATEKASPSSVGVKLVGEPNGKDVILRYRLAGGEIQTGLMLFEGESENFFLLMVEPPKRVTPELIPPRELVFVLDVSGSMRGFPMDTARTLMRELVAGMGPADTFNVLLFSGGSRLFSPKSLPATKENLEKALAEVEVLDAGGGTELDAALKRALALPAGKGVSRSFLVITDGYVTGERDVMRHVRENLGEANVFSFGIGTGVNRYLVEGLAKAGMGAPFVVTKKEEAREAALRFKKYVEAPVLTDLKVDFGNFDVHDVEPASIPDVLAERPVIVHGKWRGKPSGDVTLTGTTGRGGYSKKLAVAAAKPEERHRALRHLWARTRIANVSDFSFGKQTDDEKKIVTALGLEYSLLTKYTSFVAVHEEVRNLAGKAQDVAQPLGMPSGVSELAVASYDRGPEPSLWLIGGLPAAGALASWLRRRRARS